MSRHRATEEVALRGDSAAPGACLSPAALGWDGQCLGEYSTGAEQHAPLQAKIPPAATVMFVDKTIGAQQYYFQVYGSADNFNAITNWEELPVQLANYSKIQHLILFFHGAPGQMVLNTSNKSLKQIGDLIQEPMMKIQPPKITLDGCNVAEDAVSAFAFAGRFKIKELSGWNYWHQLQNVQLTVSEAPHTEPADEPSEDGIPLDLLAPYIPKATGTRIAHYSVDELRAMAPAALCAECFTLDGREMDLEELLKTGAIDPLSDHRPGDEQYPYPRRAAEQIQLKSEGEAEGYQANSPKFRRITLLP